MGSFLNSMRAYDAYKEMCESKYFVDKSMMLAELSRRIGIPEKYICVTRPRRFGKSVMANMITAFYSRACDSRDMFGRLNIAKDGCFESHINKYNVISISFNEMPDSCTSYEQYIARIKRRLKKDLVNQYPDLEVDSEDPIWDILQDIYEKSETRFVFVLDEWDFIFHRDFVGEEDKEQYVGFLSNLLKDKSYVQLVYMTGILPIAKYSSGSELNMFAEYTMASEEKFGDCFGFTEQEVDRLYERFLEKESNPQVTREGLRTWYDGYHTKSGVRVYNPRSVVLALTNNNLGSYWTSAGPYDEIYYYINHNVGAVRDDLAQMIAKEPVSAKIQEYAAVSMNLTTRDEILSAMVVYGFLSARNGCVSIPNKELMDKFADMLRKEVTLGYVHNLAIKSEEMLRAVKAGDENKVAELMQYAHDTETPILKYNSESELTILVTLMFLSARDSYRMEREDKAGRGYVDFIFYPEINKAADAIILELKVDHTVEEAVQQIKDKGYALKLMSKIGGKYEYTGRILAVGIAYDRKEKKHTCRIEEITRS